MAQEEQLGRAACLHCGSTEFTWGKLMDTRNGGSVAFRPDGPFFTVVSTNEKVRVRKCEGCGNIQCFAEQ